MNAWDAVQFGFWFAIGFGAAGFIGAFLVFVARLAFDALDR